MIKSETTEATSIWKWVPILAGSVVLVSALYQIFQVSYVSQQNTTEISSLRNELGRLRTDLTANDVLTKSITRDLNEIETQFCASDNIRNLMHANQLRFDAMLYEELFKRPYQVGNAYYPVICNKNGNIK